MATVEIIEKHIDDIRVGDVVVHNGRERTLCSKDISRDALMGRKIMGDSYRSGTILVKVANYQRALSKMGA